MVLVSEAANVSWGVLVYGKICHREPWGMALVAGELTGAGCVDHSGRDCRWFSETRIYVSKRKVDDSSSRCW